MRANHWWKLFICFISFRFIVFWFIVFQFIVFRFIVFRFIVFRFIVVRFIVFRLIVLWLRSIIFVRRNSISLGRIILYGTTVLPVCFSRFSLPREVISLPSTFLFRVLSIRRPPESVPDPLFSSEKLLGGIVKAVFIDQGENYFHYRKLVVNSTVSLAIVNRMNW
jgi:hypothetical protein